MSGGSFDYIQRHASLDEAEEKIKEIIGNGGFECEWDGEEWIEPCKPETIERFKEGLQKIKEARIYLQRIDWFLSGDDGEDAFHKRLKEDLDKLNK